MRKKKEKRSNLETEGPGKFSAQRGWQVRLANPKKKKKK